MGVLSQLGVHCCLVGGKSVLGHLAGEGNEEGGELEGVTAVRVLPQQGCMIVNSAGAHPRLCPGVLLSRAAAIMLEELEQVGKHVVGVAVRSCAGEAGVDG